MKFILEVNNKTSQKFSKKLFSEIFKCTLESAKISCLKNKTLELSVALVEENEIHLLNKQYRQKDKPTDVLSFCEYESMEKLCQQSEMSDGEPIFLGELIVCPAYIARNAATDGETLEYALAYIVAHGILHLLGYDHGKKMFTLQLGVADQLIGA